MSESPLDIAILTDDPELTRLVAVWPKLTPEQRENPDEVAAIANIEQGRIRAALKRAEAVSLIYPDGSINEFARQYLVARMLQVLGKKSKQKQ